ncbi:MAG: replication protein P [Cellvibrionaceae bacterium]
MTPAGHHNAQDDAPLTKEQKASLANTINEAFELLRINYQHLYFSAYPEVDAVNSAKRLWLESLANYDPEIILKASHELIKQSDYLPTVSRMIKKCLELSTSNLLPDTHSAYIEACNAASPKQNHSWSHDAVFYAGKQSNWYFLASNSESIAFPIFKNHYEKLCEHIINGGTLPPITQLALPDNTDAPLSKEDNIAKMDQLRSELNI